MSFTVGLPQFGLVPGGTIKRWLVPVGGFVDEGDPLLELDAEMLEIEIPSPVSGTLIAQLVVPTQPVLAGDPIATIERRDA